MVAGRFGGRGAAQTTGAEADGHRMCSNHVISGQKSSRMRRHLSPASICPWQTSQTWR
jgi:hypothetical protein